ncbi:hypothetical protein [Streptomyces sp. JNUCC 63]
MRRTTARALPVVVLTGLMAGAAAPAAFAYPAAQVHRPYVRQPGVGAALPVDCGPDGAGVCPTASGPSEGAFLGGAPGVPIPDLALPGAPRDPVLRDTPADDPFRAQSPSLQAPYRDFFQDQAPRTPSRPASSYDPSQGQVPRDPSPSRAPSRGQASGSPSHDDGSRDASRGQASRDPGRDTAAGRDPSRDTAAGRDPSRDGGPRDPGRSCADPSDRSCAGGAAQHGVQAGAGGAFTTSLPALVAGGLLIAAALGAAVHRVWWRWKG